jgi:hypothetical protein
MVGSTASNLVLALVRLKEIDLVQGLLALLRDLVKALTTA